MNQNKHHSQADQWEGGRVKYGCQKQTYFLLIGMKTPKRITLEVSPAFIITIQFHTTFTIPIIQGKEMLIMKRKEVRRKAKKQVVFSY